MTRTEALEKALRNLDEALMAEKEEVKMLISRRTLNAFSELWHAALAAPANTGGEVCEECFGTGKRTSVSHLDMGGKHEYHVSPVLKCRWCGGTGKPAPKEVKP